jgi:hypothetical protein
MASARADLALMVMAEEVVRRAVYALRPHDIPLVLLKGALWQRTLYSGNEARPIVDVDGIVPEQSFSRARDALMKAGFIPRPNPQGPHEQEFYAPDLPLPLDLHRSLFARGRYALDSAGLFTRALKNGEIFGVPVWIPDPRDQLAHLLGHLATDHRPGSDMYRSDLARLIARTGISPEAAGEHLVRHGLARAARFALDELSSDETADWSARCRAALGPDPLGDALARLARVVVAKQGRFSMWSALCGHALNADLRHAAESALWALRTRAKRRRGSP